MADQLEPGTCACPHPNRMEKGASSFPVCLPGKHTCPTAKLKPYTQAHAHTPTRRPQSAAGGDRAAFFPAPPTAFRVVGNARKAGVERGGAGRGVPCRPTQAGWTPHAVTLSVPHTLPKGPVALCQLPACHRCCPWWATVLSGAQVQRNLQRHPGGQRRGRSRSQVPHAD